MCVLCLLFCGNLYFQVRAVLLSDTILHAFNSVIMQSAQAPNVIVINADGQRIIRHLEGVADLGRCTHPYEQVNAHMVVSHASELISGDVVFLVGPYQTWPRAM